jgi:hypothetical protein
VSTFSIIIRKTFLICLIDICQPGKYEKYRLEFLFFSIKAMIPRHSKHYLLYLLTRTQMKLTNHEFLGYKKQNGHSLPRWFLFLRSICITGLIFHFLIFSENLPHNRKPGIMKLWKFEMLYKIH